MVEDEAAMRRALACAVQAQGSTSPNPVVGAVVVKDGRVVGEGYHRGPGWPHAEVVALRAAGAQARGATLYVTLEPCCHVGLTPPCTDAILQAGVARVVAAMIDPDPRVSGRGVEILRQGGVEVEVGLLHEEAREINLPFVTAKTLGRPFWVLKVAASLDGRVATAAGESRWITGPEARRRGHRWRAAMDAVVVGSGTVLADDPLLLPRGVEGWPWRVVVDSRGRISPRSRLLRTPGSPVVVATTLKSAARWRRLLADAGAQVWVLPEDASGHVHLPTLGARLLRAGRYGVLVEGGPSLVTACLRHGLWDRALWFVAPRVLGADALPAVGPLGLTRLDAAVRGHVRAAERLGEDVLVTVDRGGA